MLKNQKNKNDQNAGQDQSPQNSTCQKNEKDTTQGINENIILQTQKFEHAIINFLDDELQKDTCLLSNGTNKNVTPFSHNKKLAHYLVQQGFVYAGKNHDIIDNFRKGAEEYQTLNNDMYNTLKTLNKLVEAFLERLK